MRLLLCLEDATDPSFSRKIKYRMADQFHTSRCRIQCGPFIVDRPEAHKRKFSRDGFQLSAEHGCFISDKKAATCVRRHNVGQLLRSEFVDAASIGCFTLSCMVSPSSMSFRGFHLSANFHLRSHCVESIHAVNALLHRHVFYLMKRNRLYACPAVPITVRQPAVNAAQLLKLMFL